MQRAEIRQGGEGQGGFESGFGGVGRGEQRGDCLAVLQLGRGGDRAVPDRDVGVREQPAHGPAHLGAGRLLSGFGDRDQGVDGGRPHVRRRVLQRGQQGVHRRGVLEPSQRGDDARLAVGAERLAGQQVGQRRHRLARADGLDGLERGVADRFRRPGVAKRGDEDVERLLVGHLPEGQGDRAADRDVLLDRELGSEHRQRFPVVDIDDCLQGGEPRRDGIDLNFPQPRIAASTATRLAPVDRFGRRLAVGRLRAPPLAVPRGRLAGDLGQEPDRLHLFIDRVVHSQRSRAMTAASS